MKAMKLFEDGASLRIGEEGDEKSEGIENFEVS
jgi:hypothetical protein